MKRRYLMIFLITLLVASVFVDHVFSVLDPSQEDPLELFVGVDVAYYNLDEMYDLIDEVTPYTNLFVIGTKGISYNETRLIETCQYLYDKELYFIIYSESSSRLEVISDIEKEYGDRFLGVYFDDEQGGKQLDLFEFRWVYEADDYSDAALQFVQGLRWWLNLRRLQNDTFTPSPSDFHLFTSDYTLYWFDYKAGYDTVFAQFGWNYSRQLNVALCRGAATVQNKEWGVIITWTYNNPPYIESGAELYNDLVLAYENGAKYILVFDSNKEYTHEILQKEHLDALEQFWNYAENNPRTSEALSERVAYVLPKDYGYGFRGPNDKIWGLWEADSLSYEISVKLGRLLEEYGSKLDIIYDDPEFNFEDKYSKIYFWNSTIISGHVSCEASSSNITVGDSVTVSGSITPAMLGNVTIQVSTDNGTTWNDLITITSASDGNYNYTWTPASIGSYALRASCEVDSSDSEVNSSEVLVTVSKISTTLSCSVSSSLIAEGDSITVSGVIEPAVSGMTVTLTFKKPEGSKFNRTVMTGSDGSFVDSFKPGAVGYWSVTVSWNGDSTHAGALSSEESFELTKAELGLELSPSMMSIVGVGAAAIVIVALVAWLVMSDGRERVSETVFAESAAKATLKNLGNGTLELTGGSIRFQLEKGSFRKRQKIAREIPFSEIESIGRVGNELSITWKGVADIFVIGEAELGGMIHERIAEALKEQRRMVEDTESANQKRNELTKMLRVAIETVDSLFDILRSLQGQVDWSRVEGYLESSEENVGRLTGQKIGAMKLDFAKLSSVIAERLPEETSKETYSILGSLYAYFSGLTSKSEVLEQAHPNYYDAKTTIQAYYLLNDIILGTIVGDEEIDKEISELVMMLEDLSIGTDSKINVDAIKLVINKLVVEKGKESAIVESRAAFRQQLKKIIPP